MNKHKKYYCVLAVFVGVDLFIRFTYPVHFYPKLALMLSHAPLLNLYCIAKGYKLVPLFKKSYPELYEKYSDIRFELTAAGFAGTLAKDGVELDDVLKAEAKEIRITRIIFYASSILWWLPINDIV